MNLYRMSEKKKICASYVHDEQHSMSGHDMVLCHWWHGYLPVGCHFKTISCSLEDFWLSKAHSPSIQQSCVICIWLGSCLEIEQALQLSLCLKEHQHINCHDVLKSISVILSPSVIKTINYSAKSTVFDGPHGGYCIGFGVLLDIVLKCLWIVRCYCLMLLITSVACCIL